MVPHLVTALTGPINELEQRILESTPVIERWFRLEWMEHTPPFYCAVDVRNAGFKLAPVDTNLFPGSWHNLATDMLPLAVQAAMAAIEKICPEAKNLLLVPGNALSSSFYLSNLAQLRRIFHQAGLNVRFGSLDPDLKAPVRLNVPGGEVLEVEPLTRDKRRLSIAGFDPCTILLNHDLSSGIPGILEELHEQYLLPPLHASTSVRRKHQHFKAYEEVAKRFGKLLGMDPWLINPMYAMCGEVDLPSGAGMACLRDNVESLLGKVRRKYKEYGINEKPFVVVKMDNGAQGASGMGILTVRDVKDLAALQAPHLAHLSGDVIVQEGVLTHERIHEAVAEPVVYMMDRYVVGGFYRVHAERGEDENLNAPGAHFVPLAFERSAHQPPVGASPPNRFYMYGVIARLAMLAASYELEATDPEADSGD